MIQKLNDCLNDIKEIRTLIKAETAKTISKGSIRKKSERIASTWLSQIGPQVESTRQISAETVKKYTDLFRRLLRITGPSNLKITYEQILKLLIKDYRKELILPLHEKPAISTSLSLLSEMFKKLAPYENDYLREAIGCAQHGFLKASVILGWSATIDRIHKKIEEIGFSTFNVTSSQMANQQKGRFKKFNQVQNVQSIGELREVFDNVTLWIIEGIGLIDANQHTRLRSCFEMRCQSAHPGDAPITEFNLLSFYSDIKEIILENPRFEIAKTNQAKENDSIPTSATD
jgi:hypothetical protein